MGSKTLTVAIIILIIFASFSLIVAVSHHRTLESINERSLDGIRYNARDLKEILISVGFLGEDLKKYNCNVSEFKQDNPSKYTYYRGELYRGHDIIEDLRMFISIAYLSKGEKAPYSLTVSLDRIEYYLDSIRISLERHAYAEMKEPMNCSIFLSGDELEAILDLMDKITHIKDVNGLTRLSNQLVEATKELE